MAGQSCTCTCNNCVTSVCEKTLSEREEQLKHEFEEKLVKESEALIERFNYVLQNEQVRTSYMLREAHRERHEKIMALRQQLECKNLAGLMYVMCSERTKSKLEKLQIIETFTNYINMLNEILTEGQEIILSLYRGHKTAARVDSEWREKMNKVMAEFQQFVYNFSGSPPEQNQYFFDLPKLLKCDAPLKDDPSEDIEEEEEEEDPGLKNPAYVEEHKTWWEKLNDDCRPFIMFGDLQEFLPNDRRETLKAAKEAKIPLKKWKEYAFHDMFLESKCPKADQIKNEYFDRLPDPQEWECDALADLEKHRDSRPPPPANRRSSRVTGLSVDMRGNMSSILKIITASGLLSDPVTKANLLGARDSMEIASTTKMRAISREKIKPHDRPHETVMGTGTATGTGMSKVMAPRRSSMKVEMRMSNRRTSFYGDRLHEHDERSDAEIGATSSYKEMQPVTKTPVDDDIKTSLPSLGALGKGHTDSLEVIPHHVPDKDSKIKYDRNCPLKTCQGLRLNSFTRGLPQYMKEGPFSQFESTYENYEPCTPEQIQELRRRIEAKKMKMKSRQSVVVEPLLEWQESVEGVAVQTSDLSHFGEDLPPCTCRDEKASVSSASAVGNVFKMNDLIPVKEVLDEVKKECLWDNNIEFDRFKVIGRESSDSTRAKPHLNIVNNWTRNRVQEIGKVLKQHPSLLDIFQANTRC